jgi:flagellar motor switch protein FliN/FliY
MEQTRRADLTGARRLSQAWADALGRSVEAMTGEQPEVTCGKQAASGTADGLFWWEQSFSLGAEPSAWVGVPLETGRELGTRVLQAAGVEEVDDVEARSTLLEILTQAFAGFAQEVGAGLAEEFTCRKGSVSVAPPDGSDVCAVTIGCVSASCPPLLVMFHPGLVQYLEPSVEVAAGEPDFGGGEQTTVNSKTLELLLDVELPVTVSFGRSQLPLQEVLKLTAGSIVELNRTVKEPVELIVNNCVIALGEVVVLEGNYGVRVQQIISREKRLWTTSESLIKPPAARA